MQHCCARQRAADQRWDFTRQGYPTGYCGGFPKSDNPHNIHGYEEWVASCEPYRHKFHTDGHATKEEACDCYLEYELDFHLRESESSNEQHKCQECGIWTTHIVCLGGYSIYYLCSEHATRDIVKKLHGPVGEIWSS